MATAINVLKQNISELLSSGKNSKFVIPEYQRPYDWTYEEIETLFEDLWEFASTSGGSEKDGTYFLGCIVSYKNENKENEIIDGQQRITSLFLLLRAIYTKLSTIENQTDSSKHFCKEIENTIWMQNKLTGQVNYDKILLTSNVINNEGNKILKNILKTGIADTKAKDNYSQNYIKFQELFDEHAQTDPLRIYEFIYALLNQVIVLPITADSQDTALTIFSTLNDRGKPLSDADIFKAKIYNHLTGTEKEEFISKWKSLEAEAKEANETIQQLFYYYMFYLRAEENDKKTTTPGIRKYYSLNKFEKLYDSKLMNNLNLIMSFWNVVNLHETIENENWSKNIKILQSLDILTSYPNEFWKYPVIIYYLTYRNDEKFEKYFSIFLNKLILELLTKYLITPTVNAVKGDILKLNIEIRKSIIPNFEFKPIEMDYIKNSLDNPNRSIVRMLLKLLAYNNAKQDKLLPDKWEIEHILPQKWQSNYFLNNLDEEIKEKIEHLGNKLPFEKRLNIVAGNGYFTKKQNEYKLSKIYITKEFQNHQNNEWKLDDIIKRDVLLAIEITDLLKIWEKNYQSFKNF